MNTHTLFVLLTLPLLFNSAFSACTKGQCKLGDPCADPTDCSTTLWCPSTCAANIPRTCALEAATSPIAWRDDLPFNKYSWLTTHNAFAYGSAIDPRLNEFIVCQEDSIADQLNAGVRGLMLDLYPYNNTIWECHTPKGACADMFAFRPAIVDLRAIAAFLSANKSEVVTLILEDYTAADGSLTKLISDAGLSAMLMPLAEMPASPTAVWPTLSQMVAKNWRLLVFTSDSKKQAAEGIPYVWNFILENQYGDSGMDESKCINRKESAALSSVEKSMVINNWFPDLPSLSDTCTNPNNVNISAGLAACKAAQNERWANYIAVDFYKRSPESRNFKAVDMVNGKFLCKCDDIHMCEPGAPDKCYGLPRQANEPCNVVKCKAGLTCEVLPGNVTGVCSGTEVGMKGTSTMPPDALPSPASPSPPTTSARGSVRSSNAAPPSTRLPSWPLLLSSFALTRLIHLGFLH